MKKLLPWLLLTGLFALSLWNGAALSAHTARWRDQLACLDPLLEQEDWPALSARLQSGYRDWSGHRTYLRTVAEHDLLEEVEAGYRRGLAFAAARESKELRAELAELSAQLEQLAEREGFRLGNIL